jgi:predicted secreted Zn-dependent protease
MSVVLIFKALNKPVACKRQWAAFQAGIDKLDGVNGASRAP